MPLLAQRRRFIVVRMQIRGCVVVGIAFRVPIPVLEVPRLLILEMIEMIYLGSKHFINLSLVSGASLDESLTHIFGPISGL